ncbi:PDZ domain-containing protein [Paenibacillus psychroresistens]|uniref:PDZ domain-containing protein n=2 Tax=Paenibacillus psychroresistens TaxID=1778678 RepID=A0A6B8RYE9_9BACL|nr:PDZ domain-containing protein [Paenibacillus psychroresistens]
MVICLLALGMLQGSQSANADDASSTMTVPQVIEKAKPFVVAIIGKPTESEDPYGYGIDSSSNRFDLAHGTGVIVGADGVILTNAHVVKNMKNIVVVTSDGKTYPGKTTHYDEVSDLALVKIDAQGLPVATFGVQSSIRVGDPVLAIGTPISFALRNSVTQGIVSGMERTINSEYLLLQTDAAINAGNSGGALLNMKGEVIGINALKFSSVGVDSLGFAIPVDTVQYVLKQFLAYGKVKRPYLGMELEEGWEAVVGLPTVSALNVAYIEPDSPAANAGIKQGDTLVSVNSDPISSLVELNEIMKKYLPGDTVKLNMKSGGADVVREVILGEDLTGTIWKQGEDGAYIDADQGKTAIGDSHFGWSMNYPAELVKLDGYGDENTIFGDAKGEFAISIQVEEKAKDVSVNGLLRKTAAMNEGMIFEKKYVDTAIVPYALVTGKISGEGYYVSRAFHKEDRIYYITLFVNTEENYKNPFKLNGYLQLMDSFSLTFDKSNTALKDISSFKDFKTITSDYGVSFDLPSEWTSFYDETSLSFADKTREQFLSVEITSASSGDTLKAWTSRQEKLFTDSFVTAYRKISALSDKVVSGVPASGIQSSSTMDSKTWQTTQTYYVIKDKYKYSFIFAFDEHKKAADMKALVDQVMDSVKIQKDTMDTSIGFIQDEADIAVANATLAYTNKKYKYTVHIPETWFSSEYGLKKDMPAQTYYFTGGTVNINTDDKTSLEDIWKKAEAGYKLSTKNDKNYKYKVTSENKFGVAVKKVEISYNPKDGPYKETQYIFKKNEIVYKIVLNINDAVHTEQNDSLIKQVWTTFQVQ